MVNTATKTENTTQVIKLASIDNGKFIFNKTNRKPFEVISNRANRIVSSINTIDNKSNLIVSTCVVSCYSMVILSFCWPYVSFTLV